MENTPLLEGLHVVDLASFIAGPPRPPCWATSAPTSSRWNHRRRRRLPCAQPDSTRPPGRRVQLPLAAGQPQQAQHRAEPEVARRPAGARAAGAVGRRAGDELPAADAGQAGPGLRGSGPPQSPADLRRCHRLRRGGSGRAQARLRRHRVLGAQRPDGPDPPRQTRRRRSNVFGAGDHPTAITLFAGIMTALYRREKTGRGARVTASLIAEGAWATGVLAAGRAGRREATRAGRPAAPAQRPGQRLPHGRRPLAAARLRQREQAGPAVPQGHRPPRSGRGPAIPGLRRAATPTPPRSPRCWTRRSPPVRSPTGASRSTPPASPTESSRPSKNSPTTPSCSPTRSSSRSTTAAASRT